MQDNVQVIVQILILKILTKLKLVDLEHQNFFLMVLGHDHMRQMKQHGDHLQIFVQMVLYCRKILIIYHSLQSDLKQHGIVKILEQLQLNVRQIEKMIYLKRLIVEYMEAEIL
jgi:hypothetical protein